MLPEFLQILHFFLGGLFHEDRNCPIFVALKTGHLLAKFAWLMVVQPRHMYKHQGSYYLMAAEGGTGVTHSVVIAISCLVFWSR